VWSRVAGGQRAVPALTEEDHAERGGRGRSVRERRQRRVLWLACGTAVVAVAGLVASAWVRSPAQVAAETAPPAPSRITAPVSYGVLRDTVVFRGTFSAARTISFTPVSAVAPGGSGPPSQSLVVSAVLARVGQAVRPGQLLVEVSDRPVFVLSGAVPAFRDMVQGESGGDIAELQAALAELGYGAGADDLGVFGPGTAAAVRQFYAAIGYRVPVVAAGGAAAAGGRSQAPRWLVEVPMSEVMFVPSFPATVAVLPRLGATVSPPLVTLRVGGLRLAGQLDPAQGGQVRAGMQVQVLSNVSGRVAVGVVSSVGQVISPGNGDAPYMLVAIRPRRSWAASWNGQSVQLTVTSAASRGAVLAVPEAAITADAGAVTSVTVMEAGGVTRRVRVITGASANGLVEVTPVGGRLVGGEQVVVGG
jgi:HlyD family secretion protein